MVGKQLTEQDKRIAELKKELGPITKEEKLTAELDIIGAENEERIRSREIQRDFKANTSGVGNILNQLRENRQ